MEMSLALQVALFVASVAIVVFVAAMLIFAVGARRQLAHVAATLERLKFEVQLMVQHSQELVRHVNTITSRANDQLDEIGEVVRTFRHWTERTDRFVTELGSALEPPVATIKRNLEVLRRGTSAFVQALLHRKPKETSHGE